MIKEDTRRKRKEVIKKTDTQTETKKQTLTLKKNKQKI